MGTKIDPTLYCLKETLIIKPQIKNGEIIYVYINAKNKQQRALRQKLLLDTKKGLNTII